MFQALVYGQAITVRTICSKDEFLNKHIDLLREKFIERGYPVSLVSTNLMKVAALPREELIKPKPAYPINAVPKVTEKPKFKPVFIVTYNPYNPDLRKYFPVPPQLYLDNPQI